MARNYPAGDVIVDILSRLPVKSLMRFRCVSKPWCSLFTNPNFITTHFLHSSKNGRHLLVHSKRNVFTDHEISLLSFETFDAPLNLDFPSTGFIEEDLDIVVGSCNGLVCLKFSRRASTILLWNPATREHKILPRPKIFVDFPKKRIDRVFVGFGFHLDDYKVIRIVKFRESGTFPAQAEVYSRSTDSWKEIDAVVPCFIYQLSCSVIINGVPYWVGRGIGELCYSKFINSFHFGEGEFKLMALPNSYDSYEDFGVELGVISNSLAVIVYTIFSGVNGWLEIWVMDDGNGVSSSWTKLFRIESLVGVGLPLGCWENGVIMWLKSYFELTIYDPKIREVKALQTFGAPKIFDVCSYRESLVRINEEYEG